MELCSHVYIKKIYNTLQGTNISHLGKRKIIFKIPFLGDMLVPWRVYIKGRNEQINVKHHRIHLKGSHKYRHIAKVYILYSNAMSDFEDFVHGGFYWVLLE